MYRSRKLIERLLNFWQYYEFVRSIRPTDVFIVSYPKSGTTWLAFLIANVIKGNSSKQVNLQNSTQYVLDINKLYLKRKGLLGDSRRNLNTLPNPRFFKVHAPYDPRLYNVIYVLRDPRDVMVSYWHYRRFQDANYSLTLRDFIERDDHWPCRWDVHVAGWLIDHSPNNLILVKYEEMHRSPSRILKKVLDFAGVEYSDVDIQNSVQASGFHRMQRLEEEFGTAEGNVAHNERFVRRGKVAGWRDELDYQDLRVLENKYARIMKLVGYEKES